MCKDRSAMSVRLLQQNSRGWLISAVPGGRKSKMSAFRATLKVWRSLVPTLLSQQIQSFSYCAIMYG